MFWTVGAGGADSGVGPRKAQGAALGHLGHYSAARCWSLLPLPGPPGTVVTPRSPPALEGMELQTCSRVGLTLPSKVLLGPPGTGLNPSHQLLRPGLKCTAPSSHPLCWKKAHMNDEKDRDTPQLPTHSLAPNPDHQAAGPCLLPHPQGKHKRYQMVTYRALLSHRAKRSFHFD